MKITVDLWQWPLVAADPDDLSADEMARANRFVFSRDRDRFIAGRARLRRILGRYLGQSPGRIAFSYGAFGRPEVTGISFNLSHSGEQAMLAVTKRAAIGVDIEAVRPIDPEVARTHFAPSEVKALMALPDAEQVGAFYRCWTRKEAYLKAVGTGLSTDLSSFTVTLDACARLVTCSSREASRWSLHDIALDRDMAGALAVHTNGDAVTMIARGTG